MALVIGAVAYWLRQDDPHGEFLEALQPESIPDIHDEQIVRDWMPGRPSTDAVEFLSNGGTYASSDVEPNLDQELLLPLLRVLKDECGTEPLVLLDDPERAFAVIVDVHSTDIDRSTIIDAIERANKDYSGLILDKWGRTWLSIDLLDQSKARLLEESGRLEQLRESISAEHELVRSGGTH